MFKKILFTLVAIMFTAHVGGATEVLFPDPELESCVREAIEKPSGEITVRDVSYLTHLECQDRNIENIDGIENLKALTKLSLWENQITDITPLKKLTRLTWLQLGNNDIEDISPLRKLKDLTRLGLAINNIQDIKVIKHLTDLKWLNLDNNGLEDGDLTSLIKLERLTWLTLEHNKLTSISGLSRLADNGCNIYWDLQDTVATGVNTPDLLNMNKNIVPGVSDKSNSQGFHPVIDGDLVIHTNPDGKVSFRYKTDKQDLPVIKEYAGFITLEGYTLVYHTKGENIDIGEMTEDGFEICSGNYTDVCSFTIGKKHPGHGAYDHGVAGESTPVITMALTTNPALRPGLKDIPKSFFIDSADTFMETHDLSPYAMASPNQWDAGSCLFMATTGAMEMLMNQHIPLDQIAYKGDTDLSERFLMNAVTLLPEYFPQEANALYLFTDTIYTYNFVGLMLHYYYGYPLGNYSMLDSDYPFVYDNIGDAYVSAQRNWDPANLPTNWPYLLVPTPAVDRTQIFAPPLKSDDSMFQVAVADHDILDIIKHELVSKNAPVVIVYNHFNYWHSDIIVGYDDRQESRGCPMVLESLEYFFNNGNPKGALKIILHMLELGGCLDKGVFYVRDSIYDGEDDEPIYNEDLGIKYSKRIIERTYNWVLYLANHGYAIHRAK